MVHCRFTSAKGSFISAPRVLTALSLILLAFPVLGQDAMTPAELLEAEEEKRNTIIFYVAGGLAVIGMFRIAWLLSYSKPKSGSNPAQSPGMRISSGRSNDPYMRRKVVKRTS